MAEERSWILTLAKQGSITFVGNIVGKVLGFLFIAVATRVVTPSTYGIFVLGVSIISFSQGIFDLNLHRSIDYFVPQHISNEERGKAKAVLVNVFVLSLLTASLGALLVFLGADLLSNLFDEPSLAYVLPVLCLAIPLGSIRTALLSSFNSIKKLKYRVMVKDIFQPLIKLTLSILLIYSGLAIFGLIAAYVLALLSVIVIGFVFLVKEIPWVFSEDNSLVSRKSIFSYSLPLMFAGVIYATVGQIDFFIIGFFLSSADVGLYKVGYTLAANILIVLSAITPVFKPMVSENRDDRGTLKSQYQLATRWVTMFTFPIAITLIVAPSPFLSLFFAPDYASAGTAVAVLALGYLLNASFGPEGMILEGIGYTRLTLFNTFILIGVNAGLDIVLVPQFGIVGAAIGTASALSIVGLLGILEILLLRGLHPFSKNLSKLWFSGVLLLSLCIVFKSYFQFTDLRILLLPLFITISYFSLIISFKGFTNDDADIAEKIDSKFGISITERVVSLGQSS